jgi:16S rRNA (guanine527-N7)-methyltransferase
VTPHAYRETPAATPPSAIVPIAPSLPAGARSKLSAYLDLLAKWNRVYNLTAIRDREQMQSLHVDDALAVLRFLPGAEQLRLLDVGSGGGVPGIPLAIARPGWHVVLLDANRKKVSFLTQAAIELGLHHVQPVASRIEDFVCGEPFDVVICRAFANLSNFARSTRALVAPGGILVAMKGVLPQDEIDALPADIGVLSTPALDVPGLDAERHLVIMQPKGAPA